MDKQTLMVICTDCFNIEEGCIIFHFVDGSDLLVTKKPSFHNLTIKVELEYDYGDKKVSEVCFIPYSSIIYVTVTSIDNLQVISEHLYHNYKNKMEEQYRILDGLDDR